MSHLGLSIMECGQWVPSPTQNNDERIDELANRTALNAMDLP